ncbi:MAG: alkaline phosphatase family protein [Peptococcaceae bacterium]|nr:alkaline phosphatase family protein [Peptococcaceae bacterium]
MLRSKGLSEKVIVLGLDGLDPRFSKAMVDAGKMPNLKKLIDMGAAREDLMLLGAMPTITPPMWATLATGAYPMTHGIIDYNMGVPGELDMTQEAFLSKFLKAEPIWNCTAEAGKKTLVFHWPGGAWPPTSDNPNLMVVDGTSPGAMGNTTHKMDDEVVVIATTNTSKGGYKPYGALGGKIDGEFDELPVMGKPYILNMRDPRIKEFYENEFLPGLVFQDYVPPIFAIRNAICYRGANMDMLADWAVPLSMSPIAEAEGWANAPEGAKEFVIYYSYGRVTRQALILKNEAGVYDKVAIYMSKEDAEPLFVLDKDVYTPNCPDMMPTKTGMVKAVRNMRLLDIEEDGSYVRLWAGCAVNCENSDCWYPRWIFDKVYEKFGPPPATSMAACQDEDIIIKCGHEQWKQSAEWQAKAMQYMMDEEGVEVVFSHFHGPDLVGHAYLKYMKERENSKVSEETARAWHENTYKWSDDYIGSFLPYIDKGWTIIVTSDHALICPEHDHQEMGSNESLNVGVMERLGYTVRKEDENGNKIDEIDWEKTRAIQCRANSIYVNLKGRDRHGIVDPADKYELEEQIITDLYGYKDPKTGKRIVALALHNKDAVLLGITGELAGDIVFMLHEGYNFDHGESLSTACGHNDTSVSPIFIAAGPGVKPGYTVKNYIREVDIAPTVSVLLGCEIPANCEGAPAYEIFTERV